MNSKSGGFKKSKAASLRELLSVVSRYSKAFWHILTAIMQL
jgi:hypothetical protein